MSSRITWAEQLELGRAFFADRRDTGPALDDVGGAAAQATLQEATLTIGDTSNRHGAAARLRQRPWHW